MITLCYKKYGWKASEGAIKSFKDKTGKDLLGVFASYITASLKLTPDTTIFERTEIFRDLNSIEIATQALHCIIFSVNENIPLDEIEDAAHRVGWTLSDKPSTLSNPWPCVMHETALAINDYMHKNLPKKKADT